MASGKKNYFRHSFFARNDMKLKLLRDKVGVGFYFYFFSLLEQCGEASSDQLKDIYEFHDSTIRSLWSVNLKKSERIANEMMSVGLLEFKKLENSFQFTIPNFAKYLGKYETKNDPNSPNKRKEKEIKEKETKLNTEDKTEGKSHLVEPGTIIKKPSPLSRLFDHMPEVQAWLDQGSHDTHTLMLKNFPVVVLTAEIPDMFIWAMRNNIRAEHWMLKRLNNIDTSKAFKPTKKSFSTNPFTSTSNPTGNPYKAQIEELERREAANG